MSEYMRIRTLDKFQRWEELNKNQYGNNPYLRSLVSQYVADGNMLEEIQKKVERLEEYLLDAKIIIGRVKPRALGFEPEYIAKLYDNIDELLNKED